MSNFAASFCPPSVKYAKRLADTPLEVHFQMPSVSPPRLRVRISLEKWKHVQFFHYWPGLRSINSISPYIPADTTEAKLSPEL